MIIAVERVKWCNLWNMKVWGYYKYCVTVIDGVQRLMNEIVKNFVVISNYN
jgi:hypothetical protein